MEARFVAQLKKAEALMDSAKEEFKKYNTRYDMTAGVDGSVKVYVNWGDWKHDHMLIEQVFKGLGARSLWTDITEEDGSDCYSAVHCFIKCG